MTPKQERFVAYGQGNDIGKPWTEDQFGKVTTIDGRHVHTWDTCKHGFKGGNACRCLIRSEDEPIRNKLIPCPSHCTGVTISSNA